MTGSPLEPIWDSLIRTIAAMVTLAPEYVVVQVHGDDGYLTLEAASNEFLDVPLSVEASSVLIEMGWSSPEPDEGAPNYFYVIGPESTPGEIADFLVRTLRDVYKVSTSAAFEMAPLELFIEVVDGEFGEPSGLTFVRGESDPRKVGY